MKLLKENQALAVSRAGTTETRTHRRPLSGATAEAGEHRATAVLTTQIPTRSLETAIEGSRRAAMVEDDHVNCLPGEREVLAARRLAGRERGVDGAEEEHEKTQKHADKHRSSLTQTPIIHLPPMKGGGE